MCKSLASYGGGEDARELPKWEDLPQESEHDEFDWMKHFCNVW
jgi:hypothetical protein